MNNELPSEVFKHWTHSREEDTENIKVYRPSEYNFPPSRGREGFELTENGEFIQYGVGPTDKSQKVMGQWKAEGANKIEVEFKDEVSKSHPLNKSRRLNIIACDENILKINLAE